MRYENKMYIAKRVVLYRQREAVHWAVLPSPTAPQNTQRLTCPQPKHPVNKRLPATVGAHEPWRGGADVLTVGLHSLVQRHALFGCPKRSCLGIRNFSGFSPRTRARHRSGLGPVRQLCDSHSSLYTLFGALCLLQLSRLSGPRVLEAMRGRLGKNMRGDDCNATPSVCLVQRCDWLCPRPLAKSCLGATSSGNFLTIGRTTPT